MAKEKKAKNEVAAEKGKSNNMLSVVIIALLTILIIGVGVFATFFLLNQKNSAKNNPSQVAAKVEAPEFAYEVKEFTLNLADENEKRYVKMKLFLGYGNKKLEAELKKKDHIIKDGIVNIVRSKSSKDLKGKGTEQLKKEIIEKVNSELTSGRISDVSIYDILVQ